VEDVAVDGRIILKMDLEEIVEEGVD
jgi:hypothetical protein